MTSICEKITNQMNELYECSLVNDAVRIRTPYLYPDGDYIDIFLKERQNTYTLTDFGETLRWLKMQTTSQYRSNRQDAILQDICQTHDIELYRGMLLTRTSVNSSLAADITRIAQAALRVSDIWFTQKTRAFESIQSEVSELLETNKIPFDQGEKYIGRSGRSRKVDFHARHPKRSSLIYVLSTGSRASANSRVNNVLASWYDLNHLKTGIEPLRFISLFDDTVDVWTPDNMSILEDLSHIAYWSQPEELIELLAA